MHDTEGETIDDVRRQRDAAIARAERLEREAVASLTAAGICLPVEEPTAQGEIPMAVHKLARERDEIDIQLAALRERLRLAMAVVDIARKHTSGCQNASMKCPLCGDLSVPLAALDAVPGDTLERP